MQLVVIEVSFELHPKQFNVIKDLSTSQARYVLLFGGSRSGKTVLICYLILLTALNFPKSRQLVARLHLSDLKSSIIYGTLPLVADLMSKSLGEYVKYKINKVDWFIEFPNGSRIWFTGVSDPRRSEKVLGNEYLNIFLSEVSEIDYEVVQKVITRCAQNISGSRNRMYFDCNPSGKSHWAYKLFVENIDPIDKSKKNKDNYYATLMNPTDNPYLPKGYLESFDDLSERQRLRFKSGEWLNDIVGALWNQPALDKLKISPHPYEQYDRIVIAVDPAVTNNPKKSDETGIIVGGLIKDKVHILNDSSGVMSSSEWGKTVVNLYHRYKADRIIAEVNQGGDLVESNIRLFDRNVPIKKVRAYKGKYLRAEPVVALYEQERIHHVSGLIGLEDQMTSWVPDGNKSPDRVDALVYCVHELVVKNREPVIYATV